MKRTHTPAPAALALLLFAPLAAGQVGFSTLYTGAGWRPVGLTSANGVLYGVSQGGPPPTGVGCGTLFQLQPPAVAGGSWSETTLYSFPDASGDLCNLIFAPVAGADGAFYGLAYEGGPYNIGGLYQLLPPASPGGAWTEDIPYAFGSGSSGYAVGSLIAGPNGSFHLLTSNGAYGWGALFQILPPATPGGPWAGTVLDSLPTPPLGQGPPDSLTMGPGGVFYGTTVSGGTSPQQLGIVFQLTPPATQGGTWTQTVLYNFGKGDGSTPNSLTVAADGAIYGTTYGTNAWTNGYGTVFALTPPASPGGAWGYATLVNFTQYNHPDSPLILRNGNLYGALANAEGGAVFELQPPSAPGGAWTTTYLHRFTDYQQPGGALVVSKTGTIYGVTAAVPGRPPGGTVYEIVTK